MHCLSQKGRRDMNKIKQVKKNGTIQLIIKSIKGQIWSENEVHAINNNKVHGLLHLDVIEKEKKHSFKLFYSITGFISLKDYLKLPLNKESFIKLQKNIMENFQSLQNENFKIDNVLLDYEHVMINPTTQSVHFIYVPIQGFEHEVSLRKFLRDFFKFCTFSSEEDTTYVKEFIDILNNGVHFSIFDLEEYLKKITVTKQQITEKIKCSYCKKEIDKDSRFCPNCGKQVIIREGEKGKTYDPLKQTETQKMEDVSITQGFSDKRTTVLPAQSGGTMYLKDAANVKEKTPYLIRENNGEIIQILQDSFKIGSHQSSNDYTVSDNQAISRNHAEIIKDEEGFFIKDFNSTNKTYVNGNAITPHVKVKIQTGMILKLANENFIFYEK